MKLYPLPGGDWAGTEADWKKGMKAKGLDPKAFEATKTREVPTGKKELMEFLTFYGVDVYRLPAGETTVSKVDVDALRAQHNPDAPDLPPAPKADPTKTLDDLFVEAPIPKQVELAVGLLDRLEVRTRGS